MLDACDTYQEYTGTWLMVWGLGTMTWELGTMTWGYLGHRVKGEACPSIDLSVSDAERKVGADMARYVLIRRSDAQ